MRLWCRHKILIALKYACTCHIHVHKTHTHVRILLTIYSYSYSYPGAGDGGCPARSHCGVWWCRFPLTLYLYYNIYVLLQVMEVFQPEAIVVCGGADSL